MISLLAAAKISLCFGRRNGVVPMTASPFQWLHVIFYCIDIPMIWHVLYLYHFMLNKSCLSLSLSLNGEASFLLFLECYTTNFPYQRYDLITLNTIYFISPFWCIAMFLLKIWNIRQYRPVCFADKVRFVNKSIVDWPLTHVVNLIMCMIKAYTQDMKYQTIQTCLFCWQSQICE